MTTANLAIIITVVINVISFSLFFALVGVP